MFQGCSSRALPLGRFAWGGQNEVLPASLRIGSVVSIALYAVFAVLILQAAGAVSLLPDGFVAVAIWVLTGYLVLGIAMNAISRSRPERLVMTPVRRAPRRRLPRAGARLTASPPGARRTVAGMAARGHGAAARWAVVAALVAVARSRCPPLVRALPASDADVSAAELRTAVAGHRRRSASPATP